MMRINDPFHNETIVVMIDQPLQNIIHKLDVCDRLVNWAVELSQFHLTFLPRTTVKSQVLTDFLVECYFPNEKMNEPENTESVVSQQ